MAERMRDFESSYNAIIADENERKSWRYYFPLTIEPAVFLFCLGSTLSLSVTTNLFLVHTCENSLGFNHTVCQELGDKTFNDTEGLESEVQHLATYYTLGKSLLESIIPAILSFYIGPWSDINGRKPLMMWPMLGFALSYLIFMVISFFPKLPVVWLMLSGLPTAFCGGFMSFVLGSYSYISDVSKPDKRTLRLGMAEIAIFGGILGSSLSVSYIYKAAGQWGYVTVYGLSAICCLLAWLYCCFLVQESVVNDETKHPCCCLSLGLFKKGYVGDLMSTCFAKRPNNSRTIILILFFVLGCCIAIMEGEMAVTFLFTRKKFGWDLNKYSLFAAISLGINIVGLFFGTHLLGSWLQLTPAVLATCAFILKIISGVVTAFSPSSWYMYLGALLSIPGACIGPWCRSILSTSVPKEDIGKAFAFVASVESLMPIASAPIYSLLYNATLQTFPGAFCMISAGVYAIDMALMIVIVILQSKKENYHILHTSLNVDRSTDDGSSEDEK